MSEVVLAGPVSHVSAHPKTGFVHQLATRAAFFIAGFSISAWAPLVPYAKARLGFNEGQLGLLLLCLGLGSVIGMPMAGALAARFGCRRIIVLMTLILCCALPALAVGGHGFTIGAALFFFGAALGSMDVTMNIQAVIVERDSGRPMMSGFHGMYSVGGIFGAGSVSLMTSAGLHPLAAVLAVVAVVLVVLFVNSRGFLPYGGDPDAPAFAVPHGGVILLGVFCFTLFLAEGSVLDWSAVFLTKLRHVDTARAGWGYVAFAVAMTTCRLSGDFLVARIGRARIVLVGCLCAAGGFLLAIASPGAAGSIAGFGLVGVGASNVVPVMFTAAGRQTIMPQNLAIAAITTLGYTGILLGPAMVGFFAHAFSLAAGLAMIATMLIAVAIGSTQVRLD